MMKERSSEVRNEPKRIQKDIEDNIRIIINTIDTSNFVVIDVKYP